MTSTRGLLSALLAAALVLGAGLASAPRPDTPVVSVRAARAPALVSGPVFNDPVAGGAPGRRVVAHLERAIDGAPRGSTIRLATYTFQLRSTADKLAAASRRGVRVHLVVDGHATPPSMLLRAMRRSGVTVTRVRGTARTARNGNMHAKLYLFSRTLGVEDVVMVGSANVATGQIGQLWTDLYTAVSDDRLHDRFTRIHRELARDQPVARPYQSSRPPSTRDWSFRGPAPAAARTTSGRSSTGWTRPARW